MRRALLRRPLLLAPAVALLALLSPLAAAGEGAIEVPAITPTLSTDAQPPDEAAAADTGAPVAVAADPPPHQRDGAAIYAAFREGLAEPDCPAGSASPRWSGHFAATATRLAGQDETLALFGYVVDAVRAAHLPTEYALIPFVESGYRPDARSRLGPTGLWQFIRMTARNHDVPIRAGYDGRLSPVDSTRAAVRYLKTLHGMFAGDWRLASMAYNAGEYRLLGALRRSGQVARDADHERLPGLAGITRAYPRKLHAISCLLQQADDRAAWLDAVERPVPRLVEVPLPADVRDLDAWSRARGLDPAHVRRLNPVFAGGMVARPDRDPLQVLVPAAPPAPVTVADADPGFVLEPPVASRTGE